MNLIKSSGRSRTGHIRGGERYPVRYPNRISNITVFTAVLTAFSAISFFLIAPDTADGAGEDVLTIDDNGMNRFEFYEPDEKYLVNVALREKISAVISQFTNDPDEIKIFGSDGTAEITDLEGWVKTGMIIRLYKGGIISDSAVIAIKGDTDGDGFITSSDSGLVVSHTITPNLDGAPLIAADANGDGLIDQSDSDLIDAHFMGAADLYGDLRIGSAFSDRDDDPDGGGKAFYKSPLFLLSVIAAIAAVCAAAVYAKGRSGKEDA